MPTVPQFPPSDRCRALGREAICGLLGPSFSLCKARPALAVSPVPFKAQPGGPIHVLFQVVGALIPGRLEKPRSGKGDLRSGEGRGQGWPSWRLCDLFARLVPGSGELTVY